MTDKPVKPRFKVRCPDCGSTRIYYRENEDKPMRCARCGYAGKREEFMKPNVEGET